MKPDFNLPELPPEGHPPPYFDKEDLPPEGKPPPSYSSPEGKPPPSYSSLYPPPASSSNALRPSASLRDSSEFATPRHNPPPADYNHADQPWQPRRRPDPRPSASLRDSSEFAPPRHSPPTRKHLGPHQPYYPPLGQFEYDFLRNSGELTPRNTSPASSDGCAVM